MYDIRRSSDNKVVSDFFVQYLNLPSTQDALGIERGFLYQMSSNDVYAAFQQSGDYIFSDPVEDISYLLKTGVRVVYVGACPGASESQLIIVLRLSYGDADYIGNWYVLHCLPGLYSPRPHG